MLSPAEADLLVSEHLGETPRAAHSRLVAHIMRHLAPLFAADADLWETVGLYHDLDYFQTSEDRTRHGLLAVKWLGDRIPPDAQQAIAAHDHRSGVQSDTLIADMLKLADVIAVVDQRLGRRLLRDIDQGDPFTVLRSRLGDRLYLCDLLQRLADKHAISLARIVAIVSTAPPQRRN